jgi:hypothetical protein
MSTKVPSVNLGQSQFQDAFFVVGAQVTPYRELRQIELEIRSLEDAIKTAEFSKRRNKIKLEKLEQTISDPLVEIDIDELKWNMGRGDQLLADSKARLEQFIVMRELCIKKETQEYWDRGYEAAECEHWPIYFGKKMALEIAATGRASISTTEQIALLSDDLKLSCMKVVYDEVPKLLSPEHRNQLIQALGGEAKQLTHN